MNDTSRFNILRLRYKAAFDAYQTIAARNAAVLNNGGKLSVQDRTDEERATCDLETARDELMASTARLGN
jgi:hypothetical protein